MFNKKLKAEIEFLQKENIALYSENSELRKERNALQDALNMSDDDKVESDEPQVQRLHGFHPRQRNYFCQRIGTY